MRFQTWEICKQDADLVHASPNLLRIVFVPQIVAHIGSVEKNGGRTTRLHERVAENMSTTPMSLHWGCWHFGVYLVDDVAEAV